MVLPPESIDHYLEDQVEKHDLYKEVIDAGVIELSSNSEWESYHQRVVDEDLHAVAARRGSLSDAQWRALNLQTIDRLNPERLYHIRKDFSALVSGWQSLLAAAEAVDGLEAKLDLINQLFPQRLFAYQLTEEQEASFAELLASAGNQGA